MLFHISIPSKTLKTHFSPFYLLTERHYTEMGPLRRCKSAWRVKCSFFFLLLFFQITIRCSLTICPQNFTFNISYFTQYTRAKCQFRTMKTAITLSRNRGEKLNQCQRDKRTPQLNPRSRHLHPYNCVSDALPWTYGGTETASEWRNSLNSAV